MIEFDINKEFISLKWNHLPPKIFVRADLSRANVIISKNVIIIKQQIKAYFKGKLKLVQ